MTAAFIATSRLTVTSQGVAAPLTALPSLLLGAEPSSASVVVFEPILPDTFTLIGFGGIVVLSIVVFYVWSTLVVPVSRTNLAASKQRGPVRDYLEELELAAASSNNNTTFLEGNATATTVVETSLDSQRRLERWLFADWLEGRSKESRRGRQKEPALPVLKSAKWNSGDNPVLAATALILVGVLCTSVTEHVVGAMGGI